MGPHLLYDLGGGAQGIRGHLEHLAATKAGMLRDLAAWTEFPADSADVLEAGLAVEKAGRGFEELTGLRDELLAACLAARRDAAARAAARPATPRRDHRPGPATPRAGHRQAKRGS